VAADVLRKQAENRASNIFAKNVDAAQSGDIFDSYAAFNTGAKSFSPSSENIPNGSTGTLMRNADSMMTTNFAITPLASLPKVPMQFTDNFLSISDNLMTPMVKNIDLDLMRPRAGTLAVTGLRDVATRGGMNYLDNYRPKNLDLEAIRAKVPDVQRPKVTDLAPIRRMTDISPYRYKPDIQTTSFKFGDITIPRIPDPTIPKIPDPIKGINPPPVIPPVGLPGVPGIPGMGAPGFGGWNMGGRGSGTAGGRKSGQDLIQVKSSLFRKFVTGGHDIYTTRENVNRLKATIAAKGTFLGYDLIPTQEDLTKLEKKRLKNDNMERNMLGSFADIRV